MARKTGIQDQTPNAIVIGVTGLAGTSSTLARADHRHALPSAASVASLGAATAIIGTATEPSSYDHRHLIDGAQFDQSTSSPNSPVHASRYLARSTNNDCDIVLQPKGAGALLANLPDSAATGGNKRGTYAVDLQQYRVSAGATGVASGNYSIIIGGQSNTASGLSSAVLGGGGGAAGTASVQNATCIGGTASGTYSFCHNGTASGSYAVSLGRSAVAQISGKYAYSSGFFALFGDAQLGVYVLRAATSDTTSQVLTTDAAVAATTNTITLPNNRVYRFQAAVTLNSATVGTGSTVYGVLGGSWIITGLIRRGANAASTALIGTPTVTSEFIDSSISAATIAVTADTTLGCVSFTVTGLATTNMRWTAVVHVTEG